MFCSNVHPVCSNHHKTQFQPSSNHLTVSFNHRWNQHLVNFVPPPPPIQSYNTLQLPKCLLFCFTHYRTGSTERGFMLSVLFNRINFTGLYYTSWQKNKKQREPCVEYYITWGRQTKHWKHCHCSSFSMICLSLNM